MFRDDRAQPLSAALSAARQAARLSAARLAAGQGQGRSLNFSKPPVPNLIRDRDQPLSTTERTFCSALMC